MYCEYILGFNLLLEYISQTRLQSSFVALPYQQTAQVYDNLSVPSLTLTKHCVSLSTPIFAASFGSTLVIDDPKI